MVDSRVFPDIPDQGAGIMRTITQILAGRDGTLRGAANGLREGPEHPPRRGPVPGSPAASRFASSLRQFGVVEYLGDDLLLASSLDNSWMMSSGVRG
jgi:hypothetical protein